jgi:hypothetical protein
MLSVFKLLLSAGSDPAATDLAGNTPLHAVRHLLDAQAFDAAAAVASALLAAAADVGTLVNALDARDRTLLTYSAACGDVSVQLTRLLLNHGARVWPGPDVLCATAEGTTVERVARERQQSAFAWFLRAAMDRCSLAGTETTVQLLGTAMAEEGSRMRRHVARTMMQLGRSAAADGPVFAELHSQLAHFWLRPAALGTQCAARIRASLGHRRLNSDSAVSSLALPTKLKRLIRREYKP